MAIGKFNKIYEIFLYIILYFGKKQGAQAEKKPRDDMA